MLTTSIVTPDIEVTTSPGRWAVLDGMFSVNPSTPTTFALALRPASAFMAPNTAAAPAMSHFICSMPAGGLRESPPESKHTPLPTSATGGSFRAPPDQRSVATRNSRALP